MNDIDEALDEANMTSATMSDAKFKGEIFLSTDGKHTVHAISTTKKGRKAALKWSRAVYDALLSRYGTKQGQAKKEYSKDEEKEKQENCAHPKTSVVTSRSEKNPGRQFNKCDVCGQFLGWVK